MLSTSTWLGASSAAWLDDANWDTPPSTGQDLLFTGAASNLANNNDLTAGTSFGSMTLSGGGYAVTGNGITLTNGIVSSQPSGQNTLSLPITLTTSPTVSVDTQGASLVIDAGISGTEGLTKTGAGSLVLAGTHTYTGNTIVNGGGLSVLGSVATSSFQVNTGGSLSGDGAIGGLTADAGAVAPGQSGPGILTVNGVATFTNGAAYIVALDGTSPGAGGYTQLVASGVVTLDGATLTPSLGFSPVGNQSFTIIDNTGTDPVNGTFNSLPEGATIQIGDQPFAISYVGGTGNDVVLRHLLTSSTQLQVAPGSSVFGQTVTVTATVGSSGATPTGSVVFFAGATNLGTASLTGGVAFLDVTTLVVGTNSITAQYQGDGSTASSTSDPSEVNVAKATVTNVLTVTPPQSVFGQSVTLTATVSAQSPGAGTPDGMVEFFVGATSLGSANVVGGIATLDTPDLPIGVSTLKAVYAGSGNFLAANSNEVSHGVGQSNVAIALATQPNPSGLGQSVKLSVTVSAATPGSGIPTGSVEFYAGTTLLGSATLNNGVTSLDTTALNGGTQAITAKYLGDTFFAGGTSASTNQQVTQSTTSTLLGVDPTSSVFGQSVTLTATVTPGTTGTPTASGSVEFKNGSASLGTVALVNGVATLVTTKLALGSNSVSATYQGDSNYLTSSSAAVTAQVSQAQTTTSLSVAPSPSVPGQSVILTTTVAAIAPGSGTPTGTVRFFQGSTAIGTATLANGAATFSVANLPIGTASFTAQYLGDTNNAASTSPVVSTNVGQADTTVSVSSSDTVPQAYRQVTLTATVRPILGTGTPTGTVVFFANGMPLGAANLTAGSASLTLRTLPIGVNAVTARYYGDSNNTASNSTDLTIIVGNPNQQFINSVYQLVMSRTVDLKSMLFWENRLAAGTSTTSVAFSIANTPEARRNSVRLQYQLYLNRSATPAEIARGLPAANTARFGAKPIVLGSNEYYRVVGGGSNEGYITALGNSILGTPFDATTQAALSRSLRAGTPRTKVATQALNTTASKQALVQDIYQTMLGREASETELNTALRNLSRPGGSLRKLQLTILGSDEFFFYASGY